MSMNSIDHEILRRDPILAEVLRRVVEICKPERAYLFGSFGRGDSDQNSDYDLMVVVEDLEEPGYRLSQRAHGQLWGLGVAADILVWLSEDFEARTHLKASLPATVLREGKLLYAA